MRDRNHECAFLAKRFSGGLAAPMVAAIRSRPLLSCLITFLLLLARLDELVAAIGEKSTQADFNHHATTAATTLV